MRVELIDDALEIAIIVLPSRVACRTADRRLPELVAAFCTFPHVLCLRLGHPVSPGQVAIVLGEQADKLEFRKSEDRATGLSSFKST